MRIWIKNFSAIAWPLVDLTCKGAPFVWQEEHEQAMKSLKSAIVHSSALISIDYSTDRAIYLSVDLSVHGVGWILAQDCSDGRRCPLCFSSISWNECESRYSQAKLELYGLFRALCASRLYLIGVCNLIVEVDASYIRGMLSNPDVQPNTAVNRWIAAILMFNFKLVHVPASKHKGPDGLSRREPAPGEGEHDDPEDWVDSALSLGIWVVSWLDTFPANSHRTDALVLALEASDNDEDFAHRARSCHDCRLPARYRTGDFIPTSRTFAHSQLLASDLAPSNVEDTSNASQQQGISAISRIGAQSQVTANPDTPDSEDSLAAERDTAAADDDGDGREEWNTDAGGDVRSPLYIDLDKLARASNNNSNSYRMVGNEQDACNLRALGKRGKYSAIGSDTDTRHRRNNYSDNIDKHFDDTDFDNTDIDTATNNNNNNNNNNNIVIDNDFNINNNINNNHTEDSTSIKFPATDNASKADAEIDRIRQYLLSQRAPPDLSADALTCFISRAQRFLIAGGRLWHQQHSG